MSLDVNLGRKFAISENLDKLVLVDETSLNQIFNTNLFKFLGLYEFLDYIQVDGLILDTVDVLETELRNSTLKRHLSTFETNLFLVTRSCLGTLVTAC